MAATGKTLTIYLAADLKKFNRGINKAEGGLKGLGNSLSKFLGPALIGASAAAGAFAVKLGVDAVNAASDLIETQNKVGVIFGESSQAILDFAQTSVTALGQTETQALDAAATFAQFGKAAGLAGADLVNFSTDFVTLSADLASFNNSSPEEAITALGSALRGEAEPLRRFGVLLDDAALKEKALALGISDGTSKLSTQQKVLAAHAVVLEQTADAQGDFARTADGLANTTRILSAAVEDAKAEIGEGLVAAIESATSAMGGSRGMADVIGEVGQGIGDLTRGVGLAVGELFELNSGLSSLNTSATIAGTSIKATDAALVGLRANLAFVTLGLSEITKDFLDAGTESRETKTRLDRLTASARALDTHTRLAALGVSSLTRANHNLGASASVAGNVIKAANKNYKDFAARQRDLNAATVTTTTTTNNYTTSIETLTKWQKKALKSEEALAASHQLTETDLGNAITAYGDAADAVRDYATAVQGDLLGGIDLGSAFEGQFNEVGGASGVSLIEGFNKQIDQADWFGNVLNEIKRQGADRTLITEIAGLGPAVGGALGQQLIDDGLIPTMSDKWVSVQETTAGLAMGLVPEFLTAGVASAAEMVTGLATQLKAEQKTLKKLGKNMAKPVGAAFKTQLAKDVAVAVRNVEAAATAARAERVASATAAQQSITDQAVATAIQNVIRRGDARAGSAVQPVLA